MAKEINTGPRERRHMTLYDIAKRIHETFYMPKWRHLAPMTVTDLLKIIEWAKRRKVFFWQELAKRLGVDKTRQVLGILTAAQLLILIRHDTHWYGDRIFYSIYMYNEAAEEYWDPDRGQ